MIGLLLVTHGDLGSCLLKTASMIYGSCSHAKALALNPGDKVEQLAICITESLRQLDEGDGTIILVDMPGGSCANAALTAVRNWQGSAVAVVAGANLPMVVQVLCRREQAPTLELMAKILDSGRQVICRLWPPLAKEGKLVY